VTSRAGVALVAIALALLAGAACVDASERTGPPAVGDVVPELRLSDQNGRTFVLFDVLKEREFVVLAFYPKAFTSG
jgi:hypothetical protein